MPTAFGRAMLDTINGPERQFRMLMQGGPEISMNCRDFLNTRKDENCLLDRIQLPDSGAVLDWGCGVGRHLLRLRQTHPSIHYCGIDVCEVMLDYCRRTVGEPSDFSASFEGLPERQYDLVLLMGNGLGVLGTEGNAVLRLKALVDVLVAGGYIVIETGNPFGVGYTAPNFTIEYGDYQDGPFPWGYSDREWISRTLEELGCDVTTEASQAPGGMFFFVIGRKGEQGSPADG